MAVLVDGAVHPQGLGTVVAVFDKAKSVQVAAEQAALAGITGAVGFLTVAGADASGKECSGAVAGCDPAKGRLLVLGEGVGPVVAVEADGRPDIILMPDIPAAAAGNANGHPLPVGFAVDVVPGHADDVLAVAAAAFEHALHGAAKTVVIVDRDTGHGRIGHGRLSRALVGLDDHDIVTAGALPR
ncbi:MAG: hypothetical protein IJY31_04900 [Muribaculaceae bacterium]|nr:hypothetical protein [Muribaculaceae bacterium]